MGEMTKETNEILQIKRQYYKELYAKPTQSKEERTQEKKYEQELNKRLHNEKANREGEINKKFTEKEIEVGIEKAKNNKAPGPDGITNEMIKEGKEELKGILLKLFNEMLQNNEKVPKQWKLGDIISIYKGKGERTEMKYQRGLSLTSCVLKCLEKIIAYRIDPKIKENSTCLQGGGKSGEAIEEYLLILQSVIDKNSKNGNDTKLVITDVQKAFDQAWRMGVFRNLASRGITGNILSLIWEINNHLQARIKSDEERYSEEFKVEESIRQGSGLSAILYAQHAGKIIEYLQKENGIGTEMGEMKVPAIGWQDDITAIINDPEEEDKYIEIMEKSAKENRIIFSKEKCKVLVIGKEKRKTFSDIRMGDYILEKMEQEKILGHTFNKENNNKSTH